MLPGAGSAAGTGVLSSIIQVCRARIHRIITSTRGTTAVIAYCLSGWFSQPQCRKRSQPAIRPAGWRAYCQPTMSMATHTAASTLHTVSASASRRSAASSILRGSRHGLAVPRPGAPGTGQSSGLTPSGTTAAKNATFTSVKGARRSHRARKRPPDVRCPQL